MVFEVINKHARPVTAAHESPAGSGARVDRPAERPDERIAVAERPMPAGVLCQLLRSAVALQAESLLRTAGALAGAWGGVLDRTEGIERDARDLSALAPAAVSAGARLPAGVDSGAGDPKRPSSVVEGLLAGHEALVSVLRQIAGANPAPTGAEVNAGAGATAGADPAGTDQAGDVAADSWHRVVTGILDRREQEMVLLRAIGAQGDLPSEEHYIRGALPKRF